MIFTKSAMPTTANALFNANENQPARPLNKPQREPKLRSIKKYVPPAFGIAVANSAFDRQLGIIRTEAIRYERITAGPAFANAIAGKTNNPELIIAPAATENTSNKPSCFFNSAK